MGKNKTKDISSDKINEKTQELEQNKRISKGFDKANQTKSK